MSWSSVERADQVLLVSTGYNGFHVTGMKETSQRGFATIWLSLLCSLTALGQG